MWDWKKLMKKYIYKNYDEYKKSQIETNLEKVNNRWVRKDDIKLLSEYIKKCIFPEIGICHGTRGGHEQKWFMEYLPGCNVYGTEISKSAFFIFNTLIWDFNKRNKYWKNRFDFMYSNSWDHAFYFPSTLRIWLETLKKNGILILEISPNHEKGITATASDPWKITVSEMITMIPKWTHKKWYVVGEIKAPVDVEDNGSVKKETQSTFLIIKRKI